MRSPGLENDELDCTTVIIGRSASQSGSLVVGHNEDDAHRLVVRHHIVKAGEHPAATRLRDGTLLYREPHTSLELPVPAGTLAYDWTELVGQDFADSFLNCEGVSICCDSAAGTREQQPELERGGIGHFLPQLVAEQAHSAREGVLIAGRLVEAYGYCDARIITIADQNEAWVLQIPGGHEWLAQRVPDDAVVVLPNYLISRKVDLANTDWFLASTDLEAHAIQRAWYDSTGTEPFDFKEAYGPPEINVSSLSTSRQQTGLFLLTGHEFPLDDMPFSCVPEHPVTIGDVMACLRCVTPHGQSTRQALAMSGSFHKNVARTTMRPISVWTTQESSVTELRNQNNGPQSVTVWRASGIPDELPYTPWYPLAMMETGLGYPDPYATGDPDHLDMSSAFWAFRLFVTAVDCDYAGHIAEVRAALLPLEAQAMDTDRLLQNVPADASRKALAGLLTAYGEGLGMEALNICSELLRQWQMNSERTPFRE
ncbi:MAG TPA: C69 family dipeptidase [Clostridia bacterium]|nr:C69 family dipeptidase [Clostridia bacterium]